MPFLNVSSEGNNDLENAAGAHHSSSANNTCMFVFLLLFYFVGERNQETPASQILGWR